MTLTEFLLARIAEDESHMNYMRQHLIDRMTLGERAIADSYSRRVLAECEKNRRIVALHESWPTLVETPIETETTNDISGYVLRASKQIAWLTTREYVARFGIDPPTAPILALLALPYADHPSFQEEWRV